MDGMEGLKKECSIMEVEEQEEEEEEEEIVIGGTPRYESIKILFDPFSIAQYRKQSERLVTLEELYPSRNLLALKQPASK